MAEEIKHEEINASVFKAYDIRGIYPTEINEQGAYLVGRAYATLMKERVVGRDLSIAVGSDARISSPALKAALVQGIIDSGLNVDLVGLVSTPTFYFAVAYFGYDGGIQVSASHNPKEWNGFKIVGRGGIPISEDTGIKELEAMIDHERFTPLTSQKGTVNQRTGVVETEVKEQLKALGALASKDQDGHEPKLKPFKIAVDGCNGTALLDMEAFFGALPELQIVKLNFTLDGNFPGHPANPMIDENTADLRKTVVEQKCDLGIAPDGDGDRYFFIDEKGQTIPQAILRGIMAQIELREDPQAKVAYDIRPGRITRDLIEAAVGKEHLATQAIITPVGHSLIKEQMLAEDAVFGGESSGHYFYKLPYGTFEAPFVLVYKFLRFLSEQNKPLSEIVAPYKRYFNSGEINQKLESRDGLDGHQVGLKKIAEFKEKFGADKNCTLSLIDGVTVEYPDYWFNLRLSNTEPLIRFTIEARDQKTMEQKRDELLAMIK